MYIYLFISCLVRIVDLHAIDWLNEIKIIRVFVLEMSINILQRF